MTPGSRGPGAAPSGDEPLVAVRDVFVGFGTGARAVMALRGIDLAVQAGERLLVQGPNGSGKSTLLRVIIGEQEVLAGSVRVGSTGLSELGAAPRRRCRSRTVGFVDQHARRGLLPELSVLGNVALQLRLTGTPPGRAAALARQTLSRLELGAFADRRVDELSGGEAQRVSVCAAVAHGPVLVLADEPTGELDEASATEVYAMLGAVAADGAAVILVSHDPRAARFADRTVQISDGRSAEQWRAGGPREQLLDDRGWMKLPIELIPAAGAHPVVVRRHPDGLVLTSRPILDARPQPAPTSGVRSTRSVTPAPSVDDAPVDGPLVSCVGVTAGYGSRVLFAGLDLDLVAGGLTVVTGPSGSGKSTLLSLVAGLQDPTSGVVRVGGVDLAGLDRRQRADLRRRWVALGPQRSALVESLTVGENLALTGQVRTPSVGTSPVGADDVDAVVEDLALSALVDQPVSQLSGGERQRTSIARCLVAGVPVVVLDEPTSQQDDRSARRVLEALDRAVARGRAVLVATHDPRLRSTATHRVGLGGRPG
jgi:peptide/nickel transport system ATP-binding protein/energy-coupling factor transport system ATP-binding protein